MFGLYLTSSTGHGNLLTAKGMQTITEHQIADLMSVNLHVEKAHREIPGLVVGKLGGPIFDLVKLIVTTLRETGEILESIGDSDLGSFMMRSFKEASAVKSADPNASVDVILSKVGHRGLEFSTVIHHRSQIAGVFPAFRDMVIVNGQRRYTFPSREASLILSVGSRLLFQEGLVSYPCHCYPIWIFQEASFSTSGHFPDSCFQ